MKVTWFKLKETDMFVVYGRYYRTGEDNDGTGKIYIRKDSFVGNSYPQKLTFNIDEIYLNGGLF